MAFPPFPQRPRVFLTCGVGVRAPAVRNRGAGAVRGGWPRRVRERGRDEARPAPRPPPPTVLHKLYELIVASYLKNRAA